MKWEPGKFAARLRSTKQGGVRCITSPGNGAPNVWAGHHA